MNNRFKAFSRKYCFYALGLLLLYSPLRAEGELFRMLSYGDPAATVVEKLKNDPAIYVDQLPPFTQPGYYVQLAPQIVYQLKPLLLNGVLNAVELQSARPLTSEDYYSGIPLMVKPIERYLDQNFGGSSVSIENVLLPSDKLLAKNKTWEPLATWHGEQVIAQTGAQQLGAFFHVVVRFNYDADVSRYAELQRTEAYASYMQKSVRRKRVSEKLGKVFGGG